MPKGEGKGSGKGNGAHHRGGAAMTIGGGSNNGKAAGNVKPSQSGHSPGSLPSHESNNDDMDIELRKQIGTQYGELTYDLAQQRMNFALIKDCILKYQKFLMVYDKCYSSYKTSYSGFGRHVKDGTPGWYFTNDKQIHAWNVEINEKRQEPLDYYHANCDTLKQKVLGWVPAVKPPKQTKIREANYKKVAVEAMIIDSYDLMMSNIKHMDEKLAIKPLRAVSFPNRPAIMPEKVWGGLIESLTSIIDHFTSPYLLHTRVKALGQRDPSVLNIVWKVSGVRPNLDYKGQGDASSGYYLNLQFHEVTEESWYHDQILRMADDYEVALLNSFNWIMKSTEPIPTTIGIPALPIISHSIPTSLEPHVNFMCLMMAINRIPRPPFPFKIVLFVPPNRNVADFEKVLQEKCKLTKNALPVTSHREMVSAKFSTFNWMKSSVAPFDRVQRMQVSVDTLNAAYYGGYILKDQGFKGIDFMPHAIRYTFVQRARQYEKYLQGVKDSFKTNIIVLPGAIGPGRNALDVAIYFTRRGKRAVVMNAASGYNTGGGFVHGGRHAMEEGMCTQTTLYPTLSAAVEHGVEPEKAKEIFQMMMVERRTHLHIPEDGAVVSPSVEIFRHSIFRGYEFMERPVAIAGVVSVAAYNANSAMKDAPMDIPRGFGNQVFGMKKKFQAALIGAMRLKAEALIIPDIGTGVYKCDPNMIARALADVLMDFKGCFKYIALLGTDQFCKSVVNYSARIFTTAMIHGRHVPGEREQDAETHINNVLKIPDSKVILKQPTYLSEDDAMCDPKKEKFSENIFLSRAKPGPVPPSEKPPQDGEHERPSHRSHGGGDRESTRESVRPSHRTDRSSKGKGAIRE